MAANMQKLSSQYLSVHFCTVNSKLTHKLTIISSLTTRKDGKEDGCDIEMC